MNAIEATLERMRRSRLLALALGLLLLAGVATLVVVLVTGSSDDEPTPLTQEQSERLALARFTNHQAGTGTFEASVPVTDTTVELCGAVDWREHLGTAAVRSPGTAGEDESGLVQWSFSTVGLRPDEVDEPPARLPRGGWSFRRLQPGALPVDTVLVLLLNLAIDRPENPQLLQQNGAERLGEGVVDGVPVEIFSGPDEPGSAESESDSAGEEEGEPRLRYWVDEEGQLRRLEARVGVAEEPATIDLDLERDRDVEVTPSLRVPDERGEDGSKSPELG